MIVCRVEGIIIRQKIVPDFACKRTFTNHQRLAPAFNDFHEGSTTYKFVPNFFIGVAPWFGLVPKN